MRATSFISIFLLSLLFSGCSFYNEVIKQSANEEKIMQVTKKGEIVSSLETKSVLFATYLNRLEPDKYKDGEYFLINSYINDDFKDIEKRGLNNPFYSIELGDSRAQNLKKPVKIVYLDKDDELVKRYSIYNRWGENYLVEFESVDEDKIYLFYKHVDYGEDRIKFSKNILEY